MKKFELPKFLKWHFFELTLLPIAYFYREKGHKLSFFELTLKISTFFISYINRLQPLNMLELLKQQSGYFTGTYRFVSVRMEAAVLIHYLHYVKK